MPSRRFYIPTLIAGMILTVCFYLFISFILFMYNISIGGLQFFMEQVAGTSLSTIHFYNYSLLLLGHAMRQKLRSPSATGPL